MRAHVVQDGVVVNTIDVETLDFMLGLVEATEGGIGWTFDGHVFTPPPSWPDLAAGKVELDSLINAKRDRLEESGFPYQGKVLDSDSRSVQRINTAAQAAQVALATSQPFSIDWTCADNSTLTLDAHGMIGVPVALAMHANALHQHARSLKVLVDAALTSADLEAINVDSGWPE